MSDFFRREVALHRQRAAVGSIRLVRPLTLSVLTAFVAAVAAAVATWLATAFYSREVHIHGVMEAVAGGGSQATLFATAANARTLRPGLPVRFRYPALPPGASVANAGTVVSVSRSAARGDGSRQLPAGCDAREPLYRVTARSISPVAPGEATAAGPVDVDADVRIGRRRLIEWLFDPRARAVAPM